MWNPYEFTEKNFYSAKNFLSCFCVYFVVRKALREGGLYNRKNTNIYKKTGIIAASIAVSIMILTLCVNSSPALAATLSKLPVVGRIVKVLTIKEYTINEDKYKAKIKVPSIEGIENKTLKKTLNEKYLDENKVLYEEFITEMEALKKNGGGNLGVQSGYAVKTDTENILSIGRYVVNTVGSSSTTFKYDTVDKKNEVLITLPSLFKDDRYVEILSENIKAQILAQIKSDPQKIYWIDSKDKKSVVTPFEKIVINQNFYINSQNKLVLSFDKYEIAPGSMGIIEFVIPTEALSDILVSNEYIK